MRVDLLWIDTSAPVQPTQGESEWLQLEVSRPDVTFYDVLRRNIQLRAISFNEQDRSAVWYKPAADESYMNYNAPTFTPTKN